MDLYLLGKICPGISNPQINAKKRNGFFFAAHYRQGDTLQYDVRELRRDINLIPKNSARYELTPEVFSNSFFYTTGISDLDCTQS